MKILCPYQFEQKYFAYLVVWHAPSCVRRALYEPLGVCARSAHGYLTQLDDGALVGVAVGREAVGQLAHVELELRAALDAWHAQ